MKRTVPRSEDLLDQFDQVEKRFPIRLGLGYTEPNKQCPLLFGVSSSQVARNLNRVQLTGRLALVPATAEEGPRGEVSQRQ